MTESACQAPTTKRRRIDWLLTLSAIAITMLYVMHWQFAHAISGSLHIAAHAAFELTNIIWWGILLGIVMIAILGRIPREFVMSALGTKTGVRGVFRATFAGLLLDLCNHGVLMVGSRLYERGASIGQVIAFLVSSPWNSISLTIILIALIGVPWTLAFVTFSMIIAIITGAIFDLLVQRRVLPENPVKVDMPAGWRFWPEAKRSLASTEFTPALITGMLIEGIKESRMVMRWMLFGVLLASAVRAFVSPEMFTTYFGPTLLGLGVTVIASTILEVCSEGTTPIAADILNRAGAPGNSFTFLMGGVATDYTEIMVLKEATGSWKIALFLPLISLPQIIALGWLMNNFG
ncbi:MAG: permease [Pseudomonadales bacterium]|nr:permease [Pseudomonadales bacterium]